MAKNLKSDRLQATSHKPQAKMIQIDDIQAFNNYDHNELLPNGEPRYRQFIQCRLPPDAEHPNGRVIELDYDMLQRQAILVDQRGEENIQRFYYRLAPRVRAKDLIRGYYGIRRFRLANIWRQEERRPGDPKLMDLTFPEMFHRYYLLQFDVQPLADRRQD
jgi:hypothetical protein